MLLNISHLVMKAATALLIIHKPGLPQGSSRVGENEDDKTCFRIPGADDFIDEAETEYIVLRLKYKSHPCRL